MSKYELLKDYLKGLTNKYVALTAEKIEEVCGVSLPDSYFQVNTTGFYKYKPIGRCIITSGYRLMDKVIDPDYKTFTLILQKMK